jgi:hypothetical protein
MLLFNQKGSQAETEIRAIYRKLEGIITAPLSASQLSEEIAIELRAEMAQSLENIHSLESQAIQSLQAAMT